MGDRERSEKMKHTNTPGPARMGCRRLLIGAYTKYMMYFAVNASLTLVLIVFRDK